MIISGCQPVRWVPTCAKVSCVFQRVFFRYDQTCTYNRTLPYKLHTFCAKQKQYLEQTAIAIRVLFSSQNRNAITNLLLLFCLQICLLLKNKAPTKTHFTATLEARKKVRYTPVLLPSLIQLCLKA